MYAVLLWVSLGNREKRDLLSGPPVQGEMPWAEADTAVWGGSWEACMTVCCALARSLCAPQTHPHPPPPGPGRRLASLRGSVIASKTMSGLRGTGFISHRFYRVHSTPGGHTARSWVGREYMQTWGSAFTRVHGWGGV